jgi:hypothetical protein
MKLLLAHTLYTLGDWVSYPMLTRYGGWLYPLYAKLMNWSSELDDHDVIWKPVEKFNEE